MDLTEYGPFATVVAVAAALVAAFSLSLVKAVGRVSHWTWLVNDTPPFMVTAGARAVAVALIGATFVTISPTNFQLFVGAAIVFGALCMFLIILFDLARRTHIASIPELAKNGQQAVDSKGRPKARTVIIGREADMRPEAAKAFAAARKDHGVSIIKFMGGYGKTLNDPGALWPLEVLAPIGAKLTAYLMGILLSATMALYIAASAIEASQRTLG